MVQICRHRPILVHADARRCAQSKVKPQISPLRYAPVEMTNLLHKKNCHLDRSVPGFPTSLRLTRPRVRSSYKENRMQFAGATKLHRKSGVA